MNRQSDISVRHSAVAGRFFPADPGRLARDVDDCLTNGEAGPAVPRAIISPHAGYPFSGQLTGAAWRATEAADTGRIAVLSPSHHHAFAGVAMPSQDRFALPGFELSIDTAARQVLLDRGLAHIEDAAHDREHGVETQLPFLNALHPGACVLPLVIGRIARGEVERIVDALAAMGKTPPLFILSSDLSHFLSLDAARAHDLETAKLIETGDHENITSSHACGAAAIRGFMGSSYGQGLRVQRLAMSNSAQVTRDTTRTVGYGAWALYSAADEIHSQTHRTALLQSARRSLASRLHKGKPPKLDADSFAHPLRGHGATFVTLQKNGALRGCIGSLAPHQPLVADVVENTIKAGFGDPRFPAVTLDELHHITLKIATLSPAAPVLFSDEQDLLDQLSPGRDGLILSDGGRRGVFLPMVWNTLQEPHDFLAALKQKAGLPKDHWSDTIRIERFYAESFAELA